MALHLFRHFQHLPGGAVLRNAAAVAALSWLEALRLAGDDVVGRNVVLARCGWMDAWRSQLGGFWLGILVGIFGSHILGHEILTIFLDIVYRLHMDRYICRISGGYWEFDGLLMVKLGSF